MKYILFIASFNAFFFIILLLQKEAKQLHDKILVAWLLYLGSSTAIYAFSKVFSLESPLISNGVIASLLLHGPFLYLYVSALTFNKMKLEFQKLWHFVPFTVFILYLLIDFVFPAYSDRIRIDHISEGGAEPPFLFLFFLIITALSGPVYFLLAHKKFRQTQKSALDFSSKETNLHWVGQLISIFGILWTLLMVVAVIHHVFHLFSMEFCLDGLFLSLSAFIILIGYFGFKQKDVFISYSPEIKQQTTVYPEIKYGSTKMEGTELQQCCNKVGQFMKTNRPYLDSDLTLPKLAEDLNVSTHHLSQVINEMHDKNFFNFINKYRVAEVKRKIQDPKYENYSLLGIAFESGFNSKSAFNRVFKNITGTTPSRYRDSLPSS